MRKRCKEKITEQGMLSPFYQGNSAARGFQGEGAGGSAAWLSAGRTPARPSPHPTGVASTRRQVRYHTALSSISTAGTRASRPAPWSHMVRTQHSPSYAQFPLVPAHEFLTLLLVHI